MRRNIVVHKYSHGFETTRLGLGPCKEHLFHKIIIVSTVQFNSFIDFEWSNNSLVDNSSHIITLLHLYCRLLDTVMSELDKIHSLGHPSGPSNVTHDSSENYFRKVNFHIFFAQFWHFALVRGCCLGDIFTYPNSKYFTPFVLLDSFNCSCFKDLSTGEK